MRNKSFIKITAVLLIAVMLVLSLASCATGGKSTAGNANGSHGALTWKYEKENQTLTVSGSGAMENFEKASSVVWKDVASSVKHVVVENGVTNIANYAFYAMTQLESVTIPASVTSIGEFAFAFTGALKEITIPDSVTALGKGAFEASGLVAVKLPAGVKAINERTFTYCDDLTTVIGEGVTTIGAEALAYCKSIKTVSVVDVAAVTAAAATIFGEGAAVPTINSATVSQFKVTIKYVDEATGAEIADAHIHYYAVGAHSLDNPTVEGYTAKTAKTEFEVVDKDIELTANYDKIPEETDPPVETESAPVEEPDDGKIDFWTWVALIGTVVILIGVAVAVILYVRNDKKKSGAKNGKKSKK